MYRTHTCGELTKDHIGKIVQLAGWVNSRRDHGGLIFIDLRDRYGITQCTVDPAVNSEAFQKASSVRSEYVIQVEGKVKERPYDMINPNHSTGMIEVIASKVSILTTSKTPPFEIEWKPEGTISLDDKKRVLDHQGGAGEEIRLKYRYLDIRTKRMFTNITLRHRFITYIRQHLDGEKFLEIETPILTKSTPEGARDYIVPARLHPGAFYALPQSPQQYKQLLMLGGIDRYFQIARCFRDEDQRGDRQPEFTQLDIEMSFVERDDVIQLLETAYKSVFKKLKEQGITNKNFVHADLWPKLTYTEAMESYGTDRPDLRFDIKIHDITEVLQETEFQVFSAAVKSGGVIRALNAKNADSGLSRSDIDHFTQLVREHGAGGLAYIRVRSANEDATETGDKEITFQGNRVRLHSPIIKFIKSEEIERIMEAMSAEPGDIIFFGAGKKSMVESSLGELRVALAKKLSLIDPHQLAICWVVDFPLFEPEMEDGHYAPSHHMFTAPNPKDIPLLDEDPLKVKSWQYDLVINGYETAGGSIRIHDPKIQEKIFDMVGFSEERKKQFSHMLEAFTYGVPPHGGIASGIERVLMLLAGEPTIREVMAFPKNQKAQDLMMNAPSTVEEKQLKEAHIKLA